MQTRGPDTPTFAYAADKQHIQSIQDDMAQCLGLALVISDPLGNFITRPSGHPQDCLLTSQPPQGCEAVRTAVQAGLVERDEKVFYVSCKGIHHVLVPIRARNVPLGMMVASQPAEAPLERGPATGCSVPELISPEQASLGRLTSRQALAVGSLLSSVANRLVELEAKNQLAEKRMRELDAMALAYDQTQQALQRLNRLFELSAEINSVQSLDGVLGEVNRHALEATQAKACNITLIDDDCRVKVRAAIGFPPRVNRRLVVRPNGLSMQVRKSGEPLIIRDALAAAEDVNPVMIQAGVRASICLPLRVKDRITGVMWVHYAEPRSLPQSDLDLLLALANQAAVAIDNARLREELVEQATRDGKTGLFNHDFFFARLQTELEKARRVGSPLSLIMIDIDCFKQYNDTLGHLAGDEALRVVARAILGKTRRSDVVARYGGEEFAVLLPSADTRHALQIAERIRASIQFAAKRLLPAPHTPPLTVSLGVASYPAVASTENELIDRADKALYQAKRCGKNTVSSFSP